MVLGSIGLHDAFVLSASQPDRYFNRKGVVKPPGEFIPNGPIVLRASRRYERVLSSIHHMIITLTLLAATKSDYNGILALSLALLGIFAVHGHVEDWHVHKIRCPCLTVVTIAFWIMLLIWCIMDMPLIFPIILYLAFRSIRALVRMFKDSK